MTVLSDIVSWEQRGAIALLVVDNPPVNALSHGVRVGLLEGMKRVQADESVAAVVLVCRGRTFIAGADIREFGKPRKDPQTNEVRDLMENGSKPVVAAIHGTALGGGLETAMTCHFRVAVESARFGLPEVKLGILPGGGGTQRLPRILGVPKALEMIVGGEPISAAEALAAGLIDEIVDGDLTENAVAFAEKMVAEERPLKRVRDLEAKIEEARRQPGLFDEYRRKVARKTRGFVAPEHCVRAIEAAVKLPFDEGLAREAELSAELHAGDQSTAQRYYFFAERQARKFSDIDRDTTRLSIERAGVLGAGTMGGGIAMNFANAGIPVTIVEANQDNLDRGLSTIRKNYERSASRGRFSAEEVERRMGLITGDLDLGAFADKDIVVEAVFENMDLKKKVFVQLDDLCASNAILASNASYLDIDEIAAVTARPSSVLGTHFFSPANVMKLVEIVRGAETSRSVLASVIDLALRLEKVPVVVGVCHGFVGNRMLAQRRAQADRLILEGALPWDVDQVLYDFGLPMGHFAMSDLAGLDIGWDRETSAGRTLREVLCERGRFGQKSGAGYYTYDTATRKSSPDAEVEELIARFAADQGIERREVSNEEILQRCTYPMINEGAKILEEGIAQRASDIDVIWVNGYGWPRYRGGPMWWADHHGLDRIVAAYETFAARDRGGWEIASSLTRLASAGRGFLDG